MEVLEMNKRNNSSRQSRIYFINGINCCWKNLQFSTKCLCKFRHFWNWFWSENLWSQLYTHSRFATNCFHDRIWSGINIVVISLIYGVYNNRRKSPERIKLLIYIYMFCNVEWMRTLIYYVSTDYNGSFCLFSISLTSPLFHFSSSITLCYFSVASHGRKEQVLFRRFPQELRKSKS